VGPPPHRGFESESHYEPEIQSPGRPARCGSPEARDQRPRAAAAQATRRATAPAHTGTGAHVQHGGTTVRRIRAGTGGGNAWTPTGARTAVRPRRAARRAPTPTSYTPRPAVAPAADLPQPSRTLADLSGVTSRSPFPRGLSPLPIRRNGAFAAEWILSFAERVPCVQSMAAPEQT